MTGGVGRSGVGMPPAEWSSRAQMLAERDAALPALEREAWLDWRRPLVGLLALALVVGGELIGGAVLTEPVDGAAEVLTLVGSVVAVVAGALLGLRVWRAGRRVVDALVAWEQLADAPGETSRVRLRLRQFAPGLIPRVVLAVLVGLPALGGIAGSVMEMTADDADVEIALVLLVVSVSALVFAAVIFGGLQRFANALVRTDRRLAGR